MRRGGSLSLLLLSGSAAPPREVPEQMLAVRQAGVDHEVGAEERSRLLSASSTSGAGTRCGVDRDAPPLVFCMTSPMLTIRLCSGTLAVTHNLSSAPAPASPGHAGSCQNALAGSAARLQDARIAVRRRKTVTAQQARI